jgi:multicomponent Na+:H+ antiporter subunit B
VVGRWQGLRFSPVVDAFCEELFVKNRSAKAPEVTGIMTRTVAKLLFLPTLVTAVAILVKGYAQPGDGFSAGVVASLGVLLQFLAFGRRRAERLPLVGLVGKGTFAGLLVALLGAAVPVLLGDPVFTHYPRAGSGAVYIGTIELITAFLFDAAVFIVVLGFAIGATKLIANTIADEDEYRGPDAADTGAGDEFSASSREGR